MKSLLFLVCLTFSFGVLAQNHSKKPIRFIFESIHDHLGNLDLNSKKVQLFTPDHKLLYEADMYEGKELDEQFFYYDDEGKLLRDHRIFHKPHESGDFKMKYDDNGNLIEETNYDDTDLALERITMTYNDKNQLMSRQVEYYHHTEDMMIVEEKFTYTYGNDGKLASRKGFEGEHEDRPVTYRYKHEANSETVSKYNSADEIREKWIKKFDDQGRIIEDIHMQYQNGAAKTKTIAFTYDEHGHILIKTLSKSGSTLKKQVIYEYVYDDYGNWVERKEKKVSGVREIEGAHMKRHIEYYEHDEYPHPPMEMDESFIYEKHGSEVLKVFQETHVRITNNEGELEWVVRRNGPILYQVDEYEYEDGKLVRINHLNNEHHENAYTLTAYNDKGLMISEISYGNNEKIDDKITFEYDEKGRLIKKDEWVYDKTHGNLMLAVTEEYKYDASGNIVEMDLKEFGDEYVMTYEYDDAGHLEKQVQTPKAKGEETTTYTYMYKGDLLIYRTEYEGKVKEPHEEVKYNYDSRGELIQSAHYRHGELHSEVDYVYFD